MLPLKQTIDAIEVELEYSGEVIDAESDNDLTALISGLLANDQN